MSGNRFSRMAMSSSPKRGTILREGALYFLAYLSGWIFQKHLPTYCQENLFYYYCVEHSVGTGNSDWET